jgi:hypothetical protein
MNFDIIKNYSTTVRNTGAVRNCLRQKHLKNNNIDIVHIRLYTD